MTYEQFNKYPLHILGINATHDEVLTAIEELVISEINYSGAVEDIASVLPYFVYVKFLQDRRSEVLHNSGEMVTVSELTFQAQEKQRIAWNIGARMLTSICETKVQTADANYKSQISYY